MAKKLNWEERWHPLREEWIIMAAHRQNRPWSGEVVAKKQSPLPEYLPACYLCPGNVRVSGHQNEDYAHTFVFDNDHPCVGPNAPTPQPEASGFYRNRPASGLARVVCCSPKHNLTVAELPPPEIADLIKVWQAQYRELSARPEIASVLIFENKGSQVGVSNPHPHCQIYAVNFVFKHLETEARISREYLAENGRTLFGDIIQAERTDGSRILYENDTAIAFLPYFARYAYEVYVAPKATHGSLADLSDAEINDLALALKDVLVRFDNLWQMPFPYVLALHQAPTDGSDTSGFHFHMEFHPPLRKPDLLKYLAGPEIGGGNFVSDTMPEEKAAELRAQPSVHYKTR
jgi:UDPglucose--hexose-1-phosphate uridylyltransferase